MKEEIRARGKELLTVDEPRVDEVSTSGTSGLPLMFCLDKDRGVREFAFLNHVWARTVYRKDNARCVLRGIYIRDVGQRPWEWEPKKPIRGILSISENLLAHQRDLTAKAFKGVKFAPSYGLSEKVAFAGEVPDMLDVYDFEPLYGYVELVDSLGNKVTEPGKWGRIVGTSFTSKG